MGSVVAPEDMIGDAAEEMVAKILTRLEGRRNMNRRTADALPDPEAAMRWRRVENAYENAIKDVREMAREAGFLR